MCKNDKVLFEDALDGTGYGKFNYLMLSLCSFMILCMMFETLSTSFLVSTSACELKTSSMEQGLMAGMPMAGIISMSHVWGYLADTRGRRKILVLSLILGLLPGILSAFSPSWIVFCLLKMVSCGAMAGTFSLSVTLLSECTPRSKRTAAIIMTTSMFIASSGIMALLAIPVIPLAFSYHIGLLNIYFNSWRLLSLIYTMPCALGAIGVYWSIESPKYLMNAGLQDEALAVLKKIYVMNNGGDDGGFQIKSIVLEDALSASRPEGLWNMIKSQSVPILKPPLLQKTILLSLMFIGLYMCVNSYLVWLPTMADAYIKSVDRGLTNLTLCEMIRSKGNDTESQSQDCVLNKNAMLVVFGESMLYAVLNVCMSWIINIYGRRRLLITIQLISGVVGLCVNLTSQTALSVVLFIIFLSHALGGGIITTFAVDFFPTHLRAMAVSLTLMMGRASAIFGINILKLLLVHNCELSFYLYSTLTLACAALAVLLPADLRKKIT